MDNRKKKEFYFTFLREQEIAFVRIGSRIVQ